ncbi:MAG TPA: type II toxin-antitoxin system HipA family toxin [Steroidobacteraceae bacterium]|jgi:serine/threonine-protein kinase HipA
MKQIFVWVRCADGAIRLVGELATTAADRTSGRFESEFEYARAWVSEPGAFALDPVSLPLKTAQGFRAEMFYPPLAVFEDALPDDWGRRLLAAAITIGDGGTPSLPEMLLRMRGGGTGALLFTPTGTAPRPDQSVPSTALPKLLAAAARFEAGTLPPGDEFRRLLEGSSRAGGARPKALVHDESGEWLAKFPSRARDDAYDVVGLEATCLALARRAGLEVPESRLQAIGTRRVLMVKRFDVTAPGGRYHMVSLRTLCKERPGIYVHSYSNLAQVLRKHSASPADDLAALYRHMVFNAAIGNVDDHLKNFWMVARPGGFRLAPAFDLVPDISGRGEHTLSFQQGFACPTGAEVGALASEWGVAGAARIIEEVIDAAQAFATTARRLKVRHPGSLQKVCADVRRRIGLLSQGGPN